MSGLIVRAPTSTDDLSKRTISSKLYKGPLLKPTCKSVILI
jgi:hypothetical protein